MIIGCVDFVFKRTISPPPAPKFNGLPGRVFHFCKRACDKLRAKINYEKPVVDSPKLSQSQGRQLCLNIKLFQIYS